MYSNHRIDCMRPIYPDISTYDALITMTDADYCHEQLKLDGRLHVGLRDPAVAS